MKAGDLNRQVTILERVVTKDTVYGTDNISWNPVKKVYAQITEMLPSRDEDIVDSISMATRVAKVMIRWRTGLTQQHRIDIDGEQWRIVAGPAMVGLRIGLEMVVQHLSTEGQEL